MTIRSAGRLLRALPVAGSREALCSIGRLVNPSEKARPWLQAGVLVHGAGRDAGPAEARDARPMQSPSRLDPPCMEHYERDIV
jgi:hypothetical protein